METLSSILETKGSALFTISPDATVFDAVEEMCRVKVGALLVVKDGGPVGIVSERDVMVRVVLARKAPETTRVEEVMTRDVRCVGPDCAPERAMAVMTQQRCRHLPVVESGRVVGMLSIGDLVRWASRHQEDELRLLEEYVNGKYPG